MSTTIQVSDSVKIALEKMRVFERETFNEIIENMLEDQMEINETTKRELEERKRSNNFVSLEEVEKKLGI
jgi:hypothetical protein